MPSVSICVPTYNGEKFLAECLDSILQQTYSDFELLIVDDCSTDGTLAVASDYATKDARVQVVRNKVNLGLVGNWNRCVELAATDWIKFVFQDDLIAPECIVSMMKHASAGAVLVSCARDFLFDDATRESDREFYRWHARNVAAIYQKTASPTAAQFSRLVSAHLGSNMLGEPTCVLFNKTAVKPFGTFNPHLIHECDNEYWCRIGTNTGTVHVPQVLATFRVHGGSTTAHNMGPRQLRKKLDPILIRHDFAFHDAYRALRAHVGSGPSPFNFTWEFWQYASAVLVREKVGDRLLASGGKTAAEFEHLLKSYPRLRSIKRSLIVTYILGFPGRVARALRRRVSGVATAQTQ